MKLTEKHSFGKATSSSPLDLDIRDDQPFEMIARTLPRNKSQRVVRHASEGLTFLDSSNKALSHQFGIGYCNTTEPDVDERSAIGASLRNEIQKISRGGPVELWII